MDRRLSRKLFRFGITVQESQELDENVDRGIDVSVPERTMACTVLAVSYFIGTSPGFHHLPTHRTQTGTTEFAGPEFVDVHEQTPSPQPAAQPLLKNRFRATHVVQRRVSVGYENVFLVVMTGGTCDIGDHLFDRALMLHERMPSTSPHPSFVHVKIHEERKGVKNRGNAVAVCIERSCFGRGDRLIKRFEVRAGFRPPSHLPVSIRVSSLVLILSRTPLNGFERYFVDVSDGAHGSGIVHDPCERRIAPRIDGNDAIWKTLLTPSENVLPTHHRGLFLSLFHGFLAFMTLGRHRITRSGNLDGRGDGDAVRLDAVRKVLSPSGDAFHVEALFPELRVITDHVQQIVDVRAGWIGILVCAGFFATP